MRRIHISRISGVNSTDFNLTKEGSDLGELKSIKFLIYRSKTIRLQGYSVANAVRKARVFESRSINFVRKYDEKYAARVKSSL